QFERVVKIDSIDEQVGGVTQINYGIRNRVLARRVTGRAAPGQPPRPGIARELFVVDISQSYYSDVRAAQYDPQYQSTGSPLVGSFSPLAINAAIRPRDTATGAFRM